VGSSAASTTDGRCAHPLAIAVDKSPTHSEATEGTPARCMKGE
jgi:hypothetical protein